MAISLTGRLATRGDVALGDACPLDRALQLIGSRSTLLLLREIFYGTSRFDALAKRVGVTDAVAAQRLRELVEVGVLTKEPYQEPGQRTRHAYVLTDRGHALLPAVLALLQWGAEHTEGPVPALTHADCGSPVRVEMHCAAGHAVAEPDVVVGG